MEKHADLQSVDMDADDTAAAGPGDTRPAEQAGEQPTQLSDPLPEEQTQSIHAWSLADEAGDITPYEHRRSWKIPAAVAAVVVAVSAAVGVGIWGWSQHQDGAGPKAAQTSAAPVPQTPDEQFIALYKQRGWNGQMQDETMTLVHDLLKQYVDGVPKDQLINDFQANNPAAAPGSGKKLINTMIDAYHPVLKSPDQRFVATLKNQGWVFSVPDDQVAAMGHKMCKAFDDGSSYDSLVDGAAHDTGISQGGSIQYVTTAINILCPQHQNLYNKN